MLRRPSHRAHIRTDMRHILLDRAGITDEREHAAVGRPRRDVDGPLAAVHVGDHAWRAAGYRKQSQIDALIVWMVRRRHFFRKTDERDPLAVRRDVREP